MPTQAPRPVRLPTLLDQQLWFIGHDIRHAEGNALTRYGFERWRATGGGTSCYRLKGDDPRYDLVCWGFGMYVGPLVDAASATIAPVCPRGVLIQRHSTTPRLVTTPLALPLHQPCELPRLHSPVTVQDWHELEHGLHALAAMLARYERWASHVLGAAHRHSILQQVPRHKRRRFSTATDLAELWSTQTAGRSVVSH